VEKKYWGICFVVQKPGVTDRELEIRAIFWKEFSQKTLLLWSVMSYIQPFIDKYIDLFTRKGDITFVIVLLNMKLCQCLKADRHITTFFSFLFITTSFFK